MNKGHTSTSFPYLNRIETAENCQHIKCGGHLQQMYNTQSPAVTAGSAAAYQQAGPEAASSTNIHNIQLCMYILLHCC